MNVTFSFFTKMAKMSFSQNKHFFFIFWHFQAFLVLCGWHSTWEAVPRGQLKGASEKTQCHSRTLMVTMATRDSVVDILLEKLFPEVNSKELQRNPRVTPECRWLPWQHMTKTISTFQTKYYRITISYYLLISHTAMIKPTEYSLINTPRGVIFCQKGAFIRIQKQI